MLTCSTNRPRKISRSIIAAITASGVSPSPAITSTSPLLAPENDRICENVVAPTMMNRIMPEMAAVQRLEESVEAERAVGEGQHQGEERADRRRFGRRRPARRHGGDDDDEDRH